MFIKPLKLFSEKADQFLIYRITDTTQKFVHTKINAYKDFHIFVCMSVIKTYITGLVLKDKNAQH